MTESPLEPARLDSRVRRGLAWSAVNNVIVRLASLGVGIILARLLAPGDFGVFAVAMTVQLVLVTLAELGISTDLVRRGDLERRGPTVATLGLAASVLTTLLMVVLAEPVATLLGSRSATPVVQVMSLTLILSGLSIVPYATIQREFLQSRQLVIDACSLVLSTTVTVGLVHFLDLGAMSLAIGRLAAQALTALLQYRVTHTRPRFGWNPRIARQVLTFGLPIAAANLLSWVVINADNMLIGHRLGAVALGFYVLAFNLSSWPMNAVGLTVRSVALPAFARLGQEREGLRAAVAGATALTTALAAPLSFLLMLFADPLVTILYGGKWAAASAVLKALGAFGLVRVLVDLFASYLYARGRSREVLAVQLVWLVTLVPAMLVGIRYLGLVGAGWAHVAVGVGVLLPAYLVVIRRTGVPIGSLVRPIAFTVLACAPASMTGLLASRLVSGPFTALLAGGTAFAAVYLAITLLWIRGPVRRMRAGASAPAPLLVGVGPVLPPP